MPHRRPSPIRPRPPCSLVLLLVSLTAHAHAPTPANAQIIPSAAIQSGSATARATLPQPPGQPLNPIQSQTFSAPIPTASFTLPQPFNPAVAVGQSPATAAASASIAFQSTITPTSLNVAATHTAAAALGAPIPGAEAAAQASSLFAFEFTVATPGLYAFAWQGAFSPGSAVGPFTYTRFALSNPTGQSVNVTTTTNQPSFNGSLSATLTPGTTYSIRFETALSANVFAATSITQTATFTGSITLIPAPASIAPLALAAAVLSRRRRP